MNWLGFIGKTLLLVSGVLLINIAFVEWKKLGGPVGTSISLNTFLIAILYITVALI